MDILKTLRFVRGAVSTKSLVPEMRHFVITDGQVRSFNGNMALSSPIALDIECAPRAVPLVQAITNCDDVVTLGMTPADRLRIKSGAFKAFIDCVPLEGLPHQQPEGNPLDLDGEHVLTAIEKLLPFVGNDASRPWTNGILLRGQSAFATNNVCLVEYWLGVDIPIPLNIPLSAIKEMARIGERPASAQVCEHSVTFHYSDGRWIRTQLYSTEWPDLSKVLDVESNTIPVPEELFKGLANVKPFVEKDGRVYFRNGAVTTSPEDDLGASYVVEGLHNEGIYNIKMLELLDGVANRVDFTAYPDPLMFYGDRLRGAIIGQRS